MPTLDLTDDETAALIAHLRHALEYDPFPYAPRLDPLKAILAKLEPPTQTKALPMSRGAGQTVEGTSTPPPRAGMTPRRRVAARRR